MQKGSNPADPKLYPLNLSVRPKLAILSEIASGLDEAIEEPIDCALRERWRTLTDAQMLELVDIVRDVDKVGAR